MFVCKHSCICNKRLTASCKWLTRCLSWLTMAGMALSFKFDRLCLRGRFHCCETNADNFRLFLHVFVHLKSTYFHRFSLVIVLKFSVFLSLTHHSFTAPGGEMGCDISKIPCRVCGGSSSGFHFGALTCEGCKVQDFTNLNPLIPIIVKRKMLISFILQ